MEDDQERSGVDISSVQTAGEIVDSRGRRWAIPSNILEQNASVHRKSALDMRCIGEDAKDFIIEWKRSDELNDAYAKGYVHADSLDVGLGQGVKVTGPNGEALEKATKVYGAQESEALRVGDLWGMKIPLVLRQRLHEEDIKAAKDAVASVGPTEKMLRQMKEMGVAFVADGKPVQVDEPLPRGDLETATKLGME